MNGGVDSTSTGLFTATQILSKKDLYGNMVYRIDGFYPYTKNVVIVGARCVVPVEVTEHRDPTCMTMLFSMSSIM
jgi:hypothetical protein